MKLLVFIIALIFIPKENIFSQNILSIIQKQKLDSIATQDVPPNAPGIATAIIQNGEIIYQKYAGYANLSDSTLINNHTRFNIASNGKQFTALAILYLIDNQQLKLSDDIRKFFPTLFPTIKKKITIQHLLNHTSGIRDCYDLWALQGYTWWKQSFNNQDVLALMEQQAELNFQTDTQYLYSNTNYILLALIIEKASGKPFVEFTNEMFAKLNMPHTSFENNYLKIRGPIAKPYFNFGTWTTYDWIWNVCGDGNIFSTLADQIQWEKLVQGKGTSEIKPAIILKSQQLIKGSQFKNYGYGLEFGKYKGLDYTFHEGATGAWKATVVRFPNKKMSMITLTNTGKSIPAMQTRQMADVIFELQEDAKYLITKPLSIGKFVSEDEILGTYLTESDFAFQFEKREDKVFLKRVGRNDVELEREAENIFRQKYDPAFKQEFTTNSKGEMQITAYYSNHSPYTLTKATANWQGFDFKALNGKFLNSETNTMVEINYKSDQTYEVKIANQDTTQGFLITPSKLLVGNYSITIEKNDSTIQRLYLNGDRIKKVRFVRQK
jgi:CubicO group peptidase (beta-lactamase class C family)